MKHAREQKIGHKVKGFNKNRVRDKYSSQHQVRKLEKNKKNHHNCMLWKVHYQKSKIKAEITEKEN